MMVLAGPASQLKKFEMRPLEGSECQKATFLRKSGLFLVNRIEVLLVGKGHHEGDDVVLFL
jgi:hypothetical protein